MTRNRILWLLLWILSLVGISFFGGNVSYGFFAVITLVPVVSFIYLLLVLEHIKLYQLFEAPKITAGHPVPFYFTLENEGLFAFSGIRVTFYSDFSAIDGIRDLTEYELLPHTKLRKDTVLTCKYRGQYLVGIRSVILRDYFCLLSLTYKNREPLEVVVLPDIISIDSLQSVDTENISARESSLFPSQADITVRDYIPGDDLRRIHWKQTAKLNKLSVRNRIGEEKDGVGLLVDTRRGSTKITEYLPMENRILETAIAIALFLKNRHIAVSSFRFQEGLLETPIDSAESFQAFYEDLSAVCFDALQSRDSFYDALTQSGSLFSKRILLVVTADEAAIPEMAKYLCDGSRDVIFYFVTADKDSSSDIQLSHRAEVWPVPIGGNLSEIL